MAARPEKPKLPEWCKIPEDKRIVPIIFGGLGRMDLPPSRRVWRLGRKDPSTSPNETPQLVLKGETCSRQHALILRDIDGGVWLQDRGSTGGTWLGEEKLEAFKPYKWNSGAKAVFGEKPRHDTATLVFDSSVLQIPRAAKGESKRAREEVEEQVCPPKQDGPQTQEPNHVGPLQPQRRGTPDEEDGQRATKQRRLSITVPIARSTKNTDTKPVIGPRPEPQGVQEATGQQRRGAPVSGPRPEPKVQPAQRPQTQESTRRLSAATPLVDNKQKSTADAKVLIGPRPEQQVLAQQRQSVSAHGRRVSTAAPPPEPSSSSAPTAPAQNGKPKKCDKCDGPHLTDHCPHFKKSREDHKDAWQNYGKKGPVGMGKSGGKVVIHNARYIRQPGDGSCLFHSLCFGLSGGRNSQLQASQLRRELALFIRRNPKLEVSGDTFEEWVRWDARTSVEQYTSRMAQGGWGGGIEMAAFALLKKVNVHVYESRGGRGYERISCFEPNEGARRTVHVLYQGGVHYDALVVN
eukprot:TRINITY_DN24786_c0_g1_i2.p1 TRINITY_DN24786_c0_g1~~TRINITY_DN24786_c0_g1_i2.p1  ORF type:complete len:519 (+),score=82.58 TRINITY_DN24786_c0_g1_i2:30-1586(+)